MASGLVPICCIALFTNPYTAYPTLAIAFIGLILVQRRNHKHSFQEDNKITKKRMDQALEEYLKVVRKNENKS
jgi:hypothetical protein